jgi:hypothetical protein
MTRERLLDCAGSGRAAFGIVATLASMGLMLAAGCGSGELPDAAGRGAVAARP